MACGRLCCVPRNTIMLPVMKLTAVALITVAGLALWPNIGTADPAEDDAVAVERPTRLKTMP